MEKQRLLARFVELAIAVQLAFIVGRVQQILDVRGPWFWVALVVSWVAISSLGWLHDRPVKTIAVALAVSTTLFAVSFVALSELNPTKELNAEYKTYCTLMLNGSRRGRGEIQICRCMRKETLKNVSRADLLAWIRREGDAAPPHGALNTHRRERAATEKCAREYLIRDRDAYRNSPYR